MSLRHRVALVAALSLCLAAPMASAQLKVGPVTCAGTPDGKPVRCDKSGKTDSKGCAVCCNDVIDARKCKVKAPAPGAAARPDRATTDVGTSRPRRPDAGAGSGTEAIRR